jgi:hypothetical protein
MSKLFDDEDKFDFDYAQSNFISHFQQPSIHYEQQSTQPKTSKIENSS